MVLDRPKQKGISFGYCDTYTGQRVYPPPPKDHMTDLLPEQQPPKQLSSHATHQSEVDDMFMKVTCTPSLGQATTISAEQTPVRFTVLLETGRSLVHENDRTEVRLWHNHDGPESWTELRFDETSDLEGTLLLNRPRDDLLHRTWFSATLKGGRPKDYTSFTLKFRLPNSQTWRWMRDVTGLEDGMLLYQPSTGLMTHASPALDQYFTGISPDIQVRVEKPKTGDTTLLYSLTCPVPAAHAKDSGLQRHQLGRAIDSSKWFALVRLWSPWLAPRQGSGSKLALDKDGVLVSFLRSDGLHVVSLAISGIDDVLTTFINDEHGNVIIKGRNDRENTGTSRVLVAIAESFEVANCAVMYHARKVVANHGSPNIDAETEALMQEHMKPQWLEEWYDGLTYCTWNGLGQNLTAEKIHEALDSLAKENINIVNLIIDDNWQSLSTGESQFKRGWTSFEANKEGFPQGMKHLTTEIRKRHPNVNHIAVWHAILGYWGGVSAEGEIADRYKTIRVEKESGVAGGEFTVVAPEDAKRMYNDFYAFLSESGIDAVKTDAQFFLDLLSDAPDRRAMIQEYQDAWTLAHLHHFSSRAISCMSQFPQALFYSQLPHNKPRLLVRNSDDFFPDIEASHPWHIFCNAHNSLLTQHLNVLPDWDMFQTSHPWASFHAAARCVSGGPIYFTDTPGKHNIELINQMTAQTPRGKTVILRSHIVGKAMNPYNSYDARALVKIGTYVRMARTGTSILGIFNVTRQHLSEFVQLHEFPGVEDGDYVVSSFTSRTISQPMSKIGENAMIGLELGVQGWEILTAYPLRQFTLHSREVRVAMLGLLRKMTGSAAVTGFTVNVEDNGHLRIWVSIKALGVLGIWFSDLEERSIQEQFMVMIYGRPIPEYCVSKSQDSPKVLEVDVEKAWKDMGEKSGWSNEVSVELFMR